MPEKIEWEKDALARMKKVPFFVRGFAKLKLEKTARERGLDKITLALLEEIKEQEMGSK